MRVAHPSLGCCPWTLAEEGSAPSAASDVLPQDCLIEELSPELGDCGPGMGSLVIKYCVLKYSHVSLKMAHILRNLLLATSLSCELYKPCLHELNLRSSWGTTIIYGTS